jgi:hypothetical protein
MKYHQALIIKQSIRHTLCCKFRNCRICYKVLWNGLLLNWYISRRNSRLQVIYVNS